MSSDIKYVEGSLYHNDDTGAVYIGLDGQIRWVPNPPTYWALFDVPLNSNCMVRFRNPDLPKFIDGPQIVDGAQLLRDDSNGQIYLVDTDGEKIVKRHIISMEVMAKYHFNSNTAIHLTHTTASAISTGKIIDYNQDANVR